VWVRRDGAHQEPGSTDHDADRRSTCGGGDPGHVPESSHLGGSTDQDPDHVRRSSGLRGGGGLRRRSRSDRLKVDGPDLAGLAGLGSHDGGGDDARHELLDDGDLT